jgi:cytochrome c553
MKLSGRMLWSVAAMAGIAASITWGVSAQSMTPPGPEVTSQSSAVKRGEHLVKSMGCWDCHTPHKMGANGPEPDMSLWLAGHPADAALPPAPQPTGPWIGSMSASFTAWAGPWGVSYTRNLTPDAETGLGEWTEQQFIDTMRTGRRQGRGRQILPPMPWPAISNLTDDELKAMFAYLRAIPPVKNRVPEPLLPAEKQP